MSPEYYDKDLLDQMPEEAFPVRCADCDYLLTGLGDKGRCPECGRPFDRSERLCETYPVDSEGPVGPDPDYDITRISEARFPVHCNSCGTSLSGLGNSGDCPRCLQSFDRGVRLWEEYGPDAFVTDDRPTPPRSAGEGVSGLVKAGVPLLAGLAIVVLMFGGQDIRAVLRDHPQVIIGGMVAFFALYSCSRAARGRDDTAARFREYNWAAFLLRC